MQLDDALSQIAEIRQQMARSQVFRGYRSATTAFSALMALTAAALERYLVGEATQWRAALWLWLATAVVSLVVVGCEMILRYRRTDSILQREMTRMAAEQFAPCLIAGALLTYAIVENAGGAVNLLPAIWSTLFGLGIFASRRVLPSGTFLIGAWYLLAGALCAVTRPQIAFSTQMACAFGGGQLLAAGVLYWTLERTHARP